MRMPSFVQLSAADYAHVAARTKDLPPGRWDADGEFVELHVDDSDCFDEFRANHPLGGNFSVFWQGAPSKSEFSKLAPPSDLPNPGFGDETCLPCDDGAADASNETATATATAPGITIPDAEGRTVPILTKTEINKMKKEALMAACKERKLLEDGSVLELKERLKQFHWLTNNSRAGGAPETAATEDDDDDDIYTVDKIKDLRIDPTNGSREFLCSWEGYDDESWEPEANLTDCEDKIAAFFSDPSAVAVGCIFGHRRGVCKCHRPLYQCGQDEAIYKPYVYSKIQWIVNGVRSLRKKTEGPGEMVSATQDEIRGFGFPMTKEEIDLMNERRAAAGRPPLKSSPGLRFLSYGKNKDGYWDFEKFKIQVTDFIDAFETVHPDWQLLFEVDWSAGHAKYRLGALNTNKMNKTVGGAQETPRDSVLSEGDFGPYSAQLNVGDTQSFVFAESDAPPFYDPTMPKYDTPSGKRDKKGKEIIKRGYVGQPKGMLVIAWERGFVPPGPDEWKAMHAKVLKDGEVETAETPEGDPALSLRHVLSHCSDFMYEKSALEEVLLQRGHILRMCVKGHPELAGCGIEYAWGRSKLIFRRHVNDRVPANLHKNILKSFSASEIASKNGVSTFKPLSLDLIRKFARKARAYRAAYRDGESNEHADIEKHVKVSKAHRSCLDSDYHFCSAGVGA